MSLTAERLTHVLPWQGVIWTEIQRQIASLPHAMLLHGAEGIGKVQFAEAFAQSLLCENRSADGFACGSCPSCGWYRQGNHPDYRRIRPEILEDAPDDSGLEVEREASKSAKASKTPSREIKIDQVRALSGFVNVSTHRHGKRVVLLYPAEALNHMAANALLKTLEEPPPETLFLLVSHHPDRLLPTIISRCRKVAMPFPVRDAALRWLVEQGVSKAEQRLSEAGGAPLTALANGREGAVEPFSSVAGELASSDAVSPLRLAERLQKQPLDGLVVSMQRWLYDVLSCKVSGRIRYHPGDSHVISELANRTDTIRLLECLRKMSDRRAVADHPLSPKLFIEDMLLDYVALFSEVHHG